jgi:uncharacterized protein
MGGPAHETIERALKRQTAAALIGPRQVGRTTLALEIGKTRKALHLDLESRSDRAKLNEPELFPKECEDRW